MVRHPGGVDRQGRQHHYHSDNTQNWYDTAAVVRYHASNDYDSGDPRNRAAYAAAGGKEDYRSSDESDVGSGVWNVPKFGASNFRGSMPINWITRSLNAMEAYVSEKNLNLANSIRNYFDGLESRALRNPDGLLYRSRPIIFLVLGGLSFLFLYLIGRGDTINKQYLK